jgi:hypothetical protein
MDAFMRYSIKSHWHFGNAAPDGRLVPQGNQDRADLKGLKMHWAAAACSAKPCKSLASCHKTCRLARCIRPEKARWMLWSLLVLATTKKLRLQPSHRFITTGFWWEGGAELEFFIAQGRTQR